MCSTTHLVALLLTLLAGPASVGAPFELRIDVNGVERTALVHPGSGAGSAPAPVILFFHGFGGNARNFAGAIRLHEAWPGATVVYPQGIGYLDGRGVARPGWQSVPGQRGDRDVAFMDALLARLDERIGIDPERIYAGGYSNGGFFVFVLMATRAETFAAFAPVACFAADEFLDDAACPRPVLYMVGRADRIYGGDPQCAGLEERGLGCARGTLETLRRLNRCSDRSRRLPRGGETWLHDPAGAPTVWYLHPGGHVWPDFASAAIADFLRAQRLSQPSQAFVDPTHFAQVRVGEPCGDAGGRTIHLVNDHPLRTLRVQVRMVRTPGGEAMRSIVLQPRSEKRLGCTVKATGAGDVRRTEWSIVEATFR